ncbi:MAG: DUF423 domain-containing protein [Flavobacteriaceae bacterium]|nr:DUF423 domain-containing protein [Flavobacteriaceae bacterium]
MKKFDKKILATASFLGALTIGIGAFGAHGLERLVDAEAVSSFETGVRYQMFHVLALLVLGFASWINHGTKKWTFWFFVLGMLLFSGSIYLLSLDSILSMNTKVLGPVTPVGGLLFIAGWLRLGLGIIKLNAKNSKE